MILYESKRNQASKQVYDVIQVNITVNPRFEDCND